MSFSKLNVVKVGDWNKARITTARLAMAYRKAIRQSLEVEANRLRNQMIKTISTQGKASGVAWPKLKSTTRAMRRFGGFSGSKALMRTGELRNSIQVIKMKAGTEMFVGVHRRTRLRSGRGAADIAKQNEVGRLIVIRTTPKMLAFLHAVFRAHGAKRRPKGHTPTGGGIIIVKIPPRPFAQPSFDKLYGNREKAVALFQVRMFRKLLAAGIPPGTIRLAAAGGLI